MQPAPASHVRLYLSNHQHLTDNQVNLVNKSPLCERETAKPPHPSNCSPTLLLIGSHDSLIVCAEDIWI